MASAVEERLIAIGQPAFLLDGDNLRHGLNGDLGFDEGAAQIRRHDARREMLAARGNPIAVGTRAHGLFERIDEAGHPGIDRQLALDF